MYVTVGFVTCRKRHDGETCIADAGVSMSMDAKWRAGEIWIQNSGIRTSLVNIRRPKTVR